MLFRHRCMTKVTKRQICHLASSNHSNCSSACKLPSGRSPCQTCQIPTDLCHRNGALVSPFQLSLGRSVTPLCSVPFGHKSYWASSPLAARWAGLAESVSLVVFVSRQGKPSCQMGCGRANRNSLYQGLSAKKADVLSQRLLSHCCQDQYCNLIYLTSFWANHVSMARNTRAVWTCWMFLCLFLPMECFNGSPWLFSLTFWLATLFSLPLSFTYQSKLWLCKEFPAKNLSKHLVLRAGKLPQYNSNWSHASFDPCISAIYRKSRIQEFDTRVRIVLAGQSIPEDHWGVYVFIDSEWSQVHMFSVIRQKIYPPTGGFHFNLTLEVFPACNPSVTPFGQCRFLWNHMKSSGGGSEIKYASACITYFIWLHN